MVDPFAAEVSYGISMRDCSGADGGLIVFDTETTGLDASADEILQVAVIDGDGKELINTRVRPMFKEEWPHAQAVHGISPLDVFSAPIASEVAGKVQDIFASAKTWVAYNGKFDLRFLEKWGIVPAEDTVLVDVMLDFANHYAEPGKNGYRWKKLGFAAEYCGYDWGEADAHDALADCRATLHVHNWLQSR